MAAYAALVSLMNDLDDIQNHPRHSFSFDKIQITSLSQTLHFLIDFMEIYDSHGFSREALESQIASAAHAAHDVIQSHVLDQIHAGSTLRGKARSYFLLDLQRAIDNMDFVWRKTMQFKAKSGLLKVDQPTYSAPASTSGKNIMVGFDAVRIQLLGMLTQEPSGHRQVIPLVGMGGIGKTTLAKNAYEHLNSQHHFDVCLWATISQQFSVETFLKQLSTNTREELHKKLYGRRYLIVLDDVWSIEAWYMIQMFLPDNVNGSCVIITTRLSSLVDHCNSPPLQMSLLDQDKSWELFCGEVFGQEKCPPELENIGKKIVKRCQGLPLSIIVIAGHLRNSSRAIEYWEKVGSLMNPISSSVEDEQCLQTISLSYHHLPPHLKPCFLYMGIYKEDEWINCSNLLKFWIAEGFLKPNQSQSLEEVAENCLKDLIDRNLVFPRKRSWNEKVEYHGIHDIVREMCLKVAKKEKFLCVFKGSRQATGRKLYIGMHRRIVGSLTSFKSTLAVRSRARHGECSLDEFSINFGSLRVSGGGCLAAAHFQLLNLRFLNFRLLHGVAERCYIVSSLSLFWNMKTLIIRNFCEIGVPYEIWDMPQLRHLEFNAICLPNPLPNEEECSIVLQNLHTLIGVENLKLTEEVCERMPHIKNLSLAYVNFLGDFEAILYCCPHNLGLFNELESLRCFFSGPDWRDFVLSFTFPASLQELSLFHSQLHWEDLSMMIKSLAHLKILQLFLVQGTEFNPVEEFTRLQILKIMGCDELIHWNADSSHFPALEILDISSAPQLSEIPSDIGEIPTLRHIKLDSCSMSASISAVRMVVHQETLGNDGLQLDVSFFEMDEVKRFQEMVREEDLERTSVHISRTFEY